MELLHKEVIHMEGSLRYMPKIACPWAFKKELKPPALPLFGGVVDTWQEAKWLKEKWLVDFKKVSRDHLYDYDSWYLIASDIMIGPTPTKQGEKITKQGERITKQESGFCDPIPRKLRWLKKDGQEEVKQEQQQQQQERSYTEEEERILCALYELGILLVAN